MKSFANALRLDKILSQMKKGDYLFIQFAHNDSKASWPQTYVEPETTYKAYLKVYIAEARLRGAIRSWSPQWTAARAVPELRLTRMAATSARCAKLLRRKRSRSSTSTP